MASVILLLSHCLSDAIQEADQRRVQDLLKAKGVDWVEVDGADWEQMELRDTLCDLSGHFGKYPQLFIQGKDGGRTEFVGLWADIEELNECNTIPDEVLSTNPQIRTFNRVFDGMMGKPGTGKRTRGTGAAGVHWHSETDAGPTSA